MIVFGIDGADSNFIKDHFDLLPNFERLHREFGIFEIEGDVRPVHSAPCWMAIFSGLKPAETAIRNFTTAQILSEYLMAWNVADNPLVVGVPITLPPVMIACEFDDWLKATLSVTEAECIESTHEISTIVNKAIYKNYDLIAAVWGQIDRMSHLYWGDEETMIHHYQLIDGGIVGRFIFDSLSAQREDWIIVSDHGFIDQKTCIANNWEQLEGDNEKRKGGHRPVSIFSTNIESLLKRPPTTLTALGRKIMKLSRGNNG